MEDGHALGLCRFCHDLAIQLALGRMDERVRREDAAQRGQVARLGDERDGDHVVGRTSDRGAGSFHRRIDDATDELLRLVEVLTVLGGDVVHVRGNARRAQLHARAGHERRRLARAHDAHHCPSGVGAEAECRRHHCTAGGRNPPSASGLASASVLRTERPFTTSATASSVIFPLRVRGMSGTCAITAGTWRGEHAFAERLPDRVAQRVVEHDAVGEAHEEHDPRVALPLLGDRDRLDHLR